MFLLQDTERTLTLEDDEEEQERNRMETRKYIERKYPEPKFKPKIVRRNCKDYIDAFKNIRG